jgi:CheY-like chemotaxis protein
MAELLVVEDDPDARGLMCFILEKAGHEVQAAGNGQEALAILGVDPPDAAKPLPDLVLLDVMMPIMDGYTAAIAMKNAPRTAKLPIVVVTAKGDMRQLFEALPTVKAFSQKPFEPKMLRETVDKALKK